MRKFLLSLALILSLTVAPVWADLNVKFGSFVKSTSAAPVAQALADLGFTPKVLLFWMAGGTTAGAWRNDFYATFGMATSTANGRTISAASRDAQALTNASQRENDNPFAIVEWGEALLASFDLTTFDSTPDFTWDNNNAVGYVVHYLALGGADITNAKVVGWTTPTATGNKDVTGFGAKPDFLLHIYNTATATGTSKQNAPLGIGVTDINGNQWAIGLAHGDNESALTATARGFVNDHSIRGQDTGPDAAQYSATHVSYLSDGFRANFDVVNATAFKVITLGITGGNFKVGTFNKTTSAAPVTQASPSLGFPPLGYMLFSDQHSAIGGNIASARLGVGGSDGTSEQSMALSSGRTTTSDVDAIDKTDKVFVKADNNSQTIEAEADHDSLGPDTFGVSWSTNDAVATPLGYWAMGATVVASACGGGLMLMGVGC